jgi:hypothetical protein
MNTKRTVLGLVILVALGAWFYPHNEATSSHVAVESTDPLAVAFGVIRQKEANVTAQIVGDTFLITYSLKPWQLTTGVTIGSSNVHVEKLVPLIFERSLM